MSTETKSQTMYGVARGEKIIGVPYPRVEYAQDDLAHASEQMVQLGLEPDLRLVEYDVETTVKTGRVRAYREPETEAPSEEAPSGEPTE